MANCNFPGFATPEAREKTAALCMEAAERRWRLHACDWFAANACVDGSYGIGLWGECGVGWELDLPVDFSLRLHGDGGADFHTLIGSIDAKTARIPKELIDEKYKTNRADIYVLCGFRGFDVDPDLHGWERCEVLLAAPVKEHGYGKLNHYIPREALRPMAELKRLLDDARKATAHMRKAPTPAPANEILYHYGETNCPHCDELWREIQQKRMFQK